MADAIVRGEISNRNDTEFRAEVTCLRSGPSGFIRGEFDALINGRDFDYSFSSNRPTSIVTRRSGRTRFVQVVFRNARVRNHTSNFTTTGATITLTARRSSTGRRTATLTIRRPGRVTLRASGFLEDGRVAVFRRVSCRR
ncbi:MAG: hypothetical protein ACOX6I_07870 [Syntrophomonadaceae bacterium]|jgi:hypothetical protein